MKTLFAYMSLHVPELNDYEWQQSYFQNVFNKFSKCSKLSPPNNVKLVSITDNNLLVTMYMYNRRTYFHNMM